MTTVKDLMAALNVITGGRMVESIEEAAKEEHPFVMWKDSGIYGKKILEIPGLIHGNLEQKIKKIAVCMTMTELSIELAGATGVDAIVAHHPIADAASCGGVTLRDYLDLYGISALECHEAFHGLHPGIAYLHGHRVVKSDISYGGVHGNVVFVGQMLPEVQTLGAILQRLDTHMGLETEKELLEFERHLKGSDEIQETSLLTKGRIYVGNESSPVQNVLHIFPHTGFSKANLYQAFKENPHIDTVIASISRVYPGHELIDAARALGLNFIVGNSHVLEILENGMPLAYALDQLLEGVEVVVFRDRVTSTPVSVLGGQQLKAYAQRFSKEHLLGRNLVSACH